jgi:hypothetical protein
MRFEMFIQTDKWPGVTSAYTTNYRPRYFNSNKLLGQLQASEIDETVFTIYLTATCFGRMTIFKQKYIC